MAKLQDWAAFGFIFCVFILTVISVLGVWKILDEDVILKSFYSVGLLGVVAAIVLIAGQFIDKKHDMVVGADGSAVPVLMQVNPLFTVIRHLMLGSLIFSVSLLALIGILAIWEVLDSDATYKSLSTMAILAFSSLVVVMTCYERENRSNPAGGQKAKMSTGTLVILIIVGLIALAMMS